MGAKRLPMRKLREILRLKYERSMRHRAIARACGVGVGTTSALAKIDPGLLARNGPPRSRGRNLRSRNQRA